MIEKYLIEHCSPTLASIKTANLFSVSLEKEKDAETQLQRWGSLLYEKGIELVVIRLCEKRALVYVYRRSMLVKDLGRQGVFDFLNKYGYNSLDPDEALCRLAYRIRCSQEFPHEIGVFLGYPLNDVSDTEEETANAPDAGRRIRMKKRHCVFSVSTASAEQYIKRSGKAAGLLWN